MKGILKYLLIAAVGYFVYDQYKKSLYTKPHDRLPADIPLGGGGTRHEANDKLQPATIEGIKKLPYTY